MIREYLSDPCPIRWGSFDSDALAHELRDRGATLGSAPVGYIAIAYGDAPVARFIRLETDDTALVEPDERAYEILEAQL